jgi:glycosyltransferase involved in cell wall biosynthesis
MNLINKYGLNQKIKFYGLLINQQKLNIIKSSDIHLHLTKWDGQPLSIIECMSQGVPSISTKVGAIPEMIENNVNGFLVDDVLDETVLLIEKIVVDSIQYHLISKNCIEHFKKRFTAEVMARKIIKMVDE